MCSQAMTSWRSTTYELTVWIGASFSTDLLQFPACLLDANRLLPENVVDRSRFSPLYNNTNEAIPVAACQINLIDGGLILGLAVHHYVSDGPGYDGFLCTWATHSKMLSQGVRPPTSLNRFDGKCLASSTAALSNEHVSEPIYQESLIVDSGDPSSPAAANPKLQDIVQQMWHFPRRKINTLKQDLTPKESEGNWISTYDAITALLWSRITNARLPIVPPQPKDTAVLIHTVDTRWRCSPVLPARSLGVSSIPARVLPTAISSIINPANLPQLAASIRASTNTIEPGNLTDTLWKNTVDEGRRQLEADINVFRGMDVGASDWRDMSAYESHDFGFGLPKAMRWPSPVIDGFFLLYPSRARVKEGPDANDEGIEVCVCLEEGSHERLMKDELLKTYAEPR
jgi:hypothetical protein